MIAGKSASLWPLVTTRTFMAIVGFGHTCGKVDKALRNAVFEVMDPCVAVIPMAVVLVPSTVATPVAEMLTSDGFPDTQVTAFVIEAVVPLL